MTNLAVLGPIQTMQQMASLQRGRTRGRVGEMTGVLMRKRQPRQQMMHIRVPVPVKVMTGTLKVGTWMAGAVKAPV